MLSTESAVDLYALADLHTAVREKLSGISFALAMRDGEGNLEIHIRSGQPCYGELRKYHKTHKEECTDKHRVNRPGDLDDPFPNGTPEGVAIGLSSLAYSTDAADLRGFLSYVLGASSPWLRAFGSPDDVEFTTKEGSDKILGFVLKNTEIDPTVLVNLLNTIKSMVNYGSGVKFFREYIAAGMSELEAITALTTIAGLPHCLNVHPSIGYYFPTSLDLVRFRDQNPHDLTGGTLRDRWDYNRRELHEIFECQKGMPKTTFWTAVRDKMGLPKNFYASEPEQYIKLEAFVPAFKEVFAETLKKQEEYYASLGSVSTGGEVALAA